MTGISLKKNILDKKLLLRLASGILLSNLLVMLIFSSKEEKLLPDSRTQIPANYLEMSIQGQFLTPFKEGRLVNILDRDKSTICTKAILRKVTHEQDFMGRKIGKVIIAVSSQCVPQLVQKTNTFIIPHGDFKKVSTHKNRRPYEVHY